MVTTKSFSQLSIFVFGAAIAAALLASALVGPVAAQRRDPSLTAKKPQCPPTQVLINGRCQCPPGSAWSGQRCGPSAAKPPRQQVKPPIEVRTPGLSPGAPPPPGVAPPPAAKLIGRDKDSFRAALGRRLIVTRDYEL